MHEIHVSERRSFRACRRRWNWAYRQGYVPKKTPKALEVGLAFHKAMEAFYEPKLWKTTSPDEKLASAKSAFLKANEEHIQDYKSYMNRRELNSEEQEEYDSRLDTVYGMLEYYAYNVHPYQDNWFTPVYVEKSFEVPLYDFLNRPLECHASPYCGQSHDNPTPVSGAGRVDALVHDDINGGYYIVDHKSTSQMYQDDSFLQLDDQISFYTAALKFMLKINIKGFIYTEYRKAYPVKPKVLQRRYQGRILSTNKVQLTNYSKFIEAIKENSENLEDYSDHLEWLQSSEAPKFHQRSIVIKTTKELRNVIDNISTEAGEMINLKLPIYPSVGRYTCSTCAYKEPCIMAFRGNDYKQTLESLYKKNDKSGASYDEHRRIHEVGTRDSSVSGQRD